MAGAAEEEEKVVGALARRIWAYMRVDHTLEPADCILVFGNNDVRTARRGAELFLAGYAPWLLFSGGFGKDTVFAQTEAEHFANVALELGVPAERILVENKATNSGQNILLSKKLLERRGIQVDKLIVVQKPYMERRVLATMAKQWPTTTPTTTVPTIFVTSPQVTFDEYFAEAAFRREGIELLVGDLQRIKEYPALGFQIPQSIPEPVWQAYESLVARGFTKYRLVQT